MSREAHVQFGERLAGKFRRPTHLDFCLIQERNYSFANVIETIEYQLKLENIQVEIRYKDHKTVASAFIKFNNLLYELGLSTLIKNANPSWLFANCRREFLAIP